MKKYLAILVVTILFASCAKEKVEPKPKEEVIGIKVVLEYNNGTTISSQQAF